MASLDTTAPRESGSIPLAVPFDGFVLQLVGELSVNRIDITMKDGDEYIGMHVINKITNVQENRLVVLDPVQNYWLILNSQDIRRAYFYQENE